MWLVRGGLDESQDEAFSHEPLGYLGLEVCTSLMFILDVSSSALDVRVDNSQCYLYLCVPRTSSYPIPHSLLL